MFVSFLCYFFVAKETRWYLELSSGVVCRCAAERSLCRCFIFSFWCCFVWAFRRSGGGKAKLFQVRWHFLRVFSSCWLWMEVRSCVVLFAGIFCSWERSQAVEDKYLGLILLLCSREVANLPYPTLCASSLSGYMFCFRWLKPKHKTTWCLWSCVKHMLLLQVSPLVSLEFSETSSRIYIAVMRWCHSLITLFLLCIWLLIC